MSDEADRPRLETRDGMTLVGTAIRTTNEAESDPATAAIGAHWRRFYDGTLPGAPASRAGDAVVYGVYTDYESDHRGAYSHLIAWEARDGGEVPEGATTLTIPRAEYLVFRGTGELPGVVARTWEAVWRHFEREPQRERAYTVDFERYDPREPSRVEIYVAVR